MGGKTMNTEIIRLTLKRIRLFLSVVWRRWDEIDGAAVRIGPRTAWDVAKIIHDKGDHPL